MTENVDIVEVSIYQDNVSIWKTCSGSEKKITSKVYAEAPLN